MNIQGFVATITDRNGAEHCNGNNHCARLMHAFDAHRDNPVDNPIYKNPRIATLKHRATPYRGEWVIYAADNREYVARHEVEELQGTRKTVESVALKSLAEAQTFSGYLGVYGWVKVWDI